MQIVSHMDSRDKHRVRGCGVLWGGLALPPGWLETSQPDRHGSGLLAPPPGHWQMATQGDARWEALVGGVGGDAQPGRPGPGPAKVWTPPLLPQFPPLATAPAPWFWGGTGQHPLAGSSGSL